MFMITSFLSLIVLIWMVARLWKQSAVLAIVSFFFWPALVYALIKNWGDEEFDIKIPFFIFFALTAYTWYDMIQMHKALKEEEEAFLMMLQWFA